MPEESVETTDEQMLAVAEQFDAAKEAGETPNVEIPEEPKEEIQDESPPEPTTESVEEPETEVLQGTEDNTDEQVSSLTEGKAPEVQEQPKSKWVKNEERKNNSWKQINAEKEENKRYREELYEVAKRLKSQQDDLNSGSAYRDSGGYTAEDYESAAKRAELEGYDKEAKEALESAKQVREEAKSNAQEREAQQYWSSVESRRQSLMLENTDLQDKSTELATTANALFESHPHLRNSVEGLESAVKIAKLQIAAAGADKSKAQVKELTDKLTKLEKKMSVGGGFTSEKVDGERSFDDLSDKEQEVQLLRAAANFDDA